MTKKMFSLWRFPLTWVERMWSRRHLTCYSRIITWHDTVGSEIKFYLVLLTLLIIFEHFNCFIDNILRAHVCRNVYTNSVFLVFSSTLKALISCLEIWNKFKKTHFNLKPSKSRLLFHPPCVSSWASPSGPPCSCQEQQTPGQVPSLSCTLHHHYTVMLDNPHLPDELPHHPVLDHHGHRPVTT